MSVDLPFEYSRNFYFGICLDNKDPLMLGRIRMAPVDENFEQRKASANGFDEDGTIDGNGPWSDKDPFIYLPFLPYFINQVPKINEHVIAFYFDKKIRSGKNKFYMIGPFSSPTTIKYEDYRSSRTNLSSGSQNKKFQNVKDGTGQYKDQEKKGVFTEPSDVTINGRDTADLIIKEKEILLRAGKHLEAQSNEIPFPNNNRAFLQMSLFDKVTTEKDPVEAQRQISNVEPIKYLIEYQCSTINTSSNVFTGMVIIYGLDNSPSTQTDFFDWETELDTGYRIVYTKTLTQLTLDNFAKEINNVIRSLQKTPSVLFNDSSFWDNNSQFPFFYRPDATIRNTLTNFLDNFNPTSLENMAKLTSQIKIDTTSLTSGYGLVSNRDNSPRKKYRTVSESYTEQETEIINNTTSILGSDTIYLLSHKSDPVDPARQKKIDLTGTIYGISANTVYDQIYPNTMSTVRGEPLLELLQLIVDFLITHDHPYPMLPPTQISNVTNISTQDILKKMNEAYEKVLNSNIRIN
jgi:hypothetical protein